MHDGRFASLEVIIEHYFSGIQDHPRLSPALTDANGHPIQLNLSEAEKSALLAFLKTLSDTSVASSETAADFVSAGGGVSVFAPQPSVAASEIVNTVSKARVNDMSPELLRRAKRNRSCPVILEP